VGAAAMSLAAWQRVSLPMLVLDVLAVAPRHGYGISQALVSAGLQPIKGAQLYPALVRLEDDGAIESRWEQNASGPARKVYELTAAGRAQREELGASGRPSWTRWEPSARRWRRVLLPRGQPWAHRPGGPEIADCAGEAVPAGGGKGCRQSASTFTVRSRSAEGATTSPSGRWSCRAHTAATSVLW